MLKRKVFNLLVVMAVILAMPTMTFAQSPDTGFSAAGLDPSDSYEVETEKSETELIAPQALSRMAVAGPELVSVIVKLEDSPLATYTGNIDKLPATSPEVTGDPALDVTSPESQAYLSYLAEKQAAFQVVSSSLIPESQVTHRFDIILGGVSMLVPADQVDELAMLPGVKAVYVDELLQLETDSSPEFVGATGVWAQMGGQENAGEGVIIGVLDTGIWPEHPSFSDPDPSGKAYAADPDWTGSACEFGSGVAGDDPFACNNKLIGAARFMTTYELVNALGPEEFPSARDDDGHGTHTASTAGGNGGVQASIYGVDRGTISGMAPRAHVAAYKVCGAAGCYGSDSAAAVQQAVLDGVDVINFSISGGNNPYNDAVELAFLDAYAAGVFVSASAGNSGPAPETTNHRGPWVTTVAASTQVRAFANSVTLTADGGASVSFDGVSLTSGVGPLPVVVAADFGDALCQNGTPDGAFTGMIVVCARGVNGRAEKGYNVFQRGAAGMILYNQSTTVTDQETDSHWLPTTHIQYTQGVDLLTFIAANSNIMGTITQGEKVSAQGDVMASFSSRGGPAQSLGVSKPDVTAPGVQILAGHAALHADIATGPDGELFQAIAGTSMSSPHVAGAGALLKSANPDWTPGQIKSALMTTAVTAVVKEDGVTPADAFDYGSGRISLLAAANVPLTFDETAENYAALQNELWNANYPSLYIPSLPGSLTVKRTVHSEFNKVRSWTTHVIADPDVKITVPSSFRIPANGDYTFSITVDAGSVPLGETRFATLELTSGKDKIHFPITFVRKQAQISLAKVCEPTSLSLGGVTNCAILAANNTFSDASVTITDTLPAQLVLVPNAPIVGATRTGNGVTFNGVLAGAQPPDVFIGEGLTPAGYLPLSLFGIAPIAGVGDETITNYNVPAFQYGSQTYTRIGIVSNGYAVVGGGTGADVQFINQVLPDSTLPNNVLAPFWTDLNPGGAGAMRVGTLTDGVDTWLILDWEGVKEYSSVATASFQIWIRLGVVEDISFAYGDIQGNGDLGYVTVGAENSFGNRGANYYVDGVGTLPAFGTELVVSTSAPQPGEEHIISFTAKARKLGAWTNCAALTSDVFQGIAKACVIGAVVP